MTVKADNGKLPVYDQPPVREVACSVLFTPIKELLSPYIGFLWHSFQPQYPFCQDATPIDSNIESIEELNTETEIELRDIPPLRRVLFFNSDKTRIIQIQPDMFVHNWRKVATESEYPRYNSLLSRFKEHLATFDDFLAKSQLGKVEPLQYELTYVNEIPIGQGWLTPEDIGQIFPDIKWKVNTDRFLPHPQTIDWKAYFDLPDKLGRLYASVELVTIDEQSTILFELTVRGIDNYTSLDKLQNWFDIAHEWIVYAFADLTDEETQTKIWKRKY